VVDPSDDANGGTYWGHSDTATPAGSQPYADVTAVRFATTKATKRVGRRSVTTVTGFTVTMRLTAAPVPPADATGIYRVFAIGPKGCVMGVEHYTRALPNAAQPRSVFFDACRGSLRRTPLKPPAIKGTTITWTVPLTSLPKDTKVGVGTTLTDLHFEVYLAHQAACTQSRPGEEREPCAIHLDGTHPQGSYVIR
jgi:hypothetical protein